MVYTCIYRNVLAQCAVPTQREWSIECVSIIKNQYLYITLKKQERGSLLNSPPLGSGGVAAGDTEDHNLLPTADIQLPSRRTHTADWA